jgi:hypothetical protein
VESVSIDVDFRLPLGLQSKSSTSARNMNVLPILRLWLSSIMLLTCFVAGAARADSWDEAIATVEQSASEYFEYAVEVGGTSHAGTMYNGYKSLEHQCAILGRMLDHVEAIRHLEEFEYPPMDARSDPHDLLIFSISLENWVAAARWAKSATADQRINRWNLDCVGQLGIASNLFVESARPEAEFVADGTQLHVYGDIDMGFAERFQQALNANPSVSEVTLGSGGGSVRDALIAGLLIRSKGLDTTIYGNCYSACPLVFLGGNDRVVWAAPYRLGFHQIYTGAGVSIPLDDQLYGLVAQYVAEMDGDPSRVLAWMFSAGPSEMFEPEPEDLCAANVATFVQRICGRDMQP